jgi:tetratricopeptide (TPR) repeat protein
MKVKAKTSKTKSEQKNSPVQSQAPPVADNVGVVRWLAPTLVVLLSGIAFFPSLRNQFVQWDDNDMFIRNLNYRGLGWTELHWMFSTFLMGHYQPLSWMTLGLDYLLWGMNPFGYHLTNLLLHVANAIVLYFIAVRLLAMAFPDPEGSAGMDLRFAAGFAALVFSIHPLRVESVAWATERRDVLSGGFFLITILCYLKAAKERPGDRAGRKWMVWALAAYVLSLLSKASGMTLPVVLLMLDVYPLRRLTSAWWRWSAKATRRVWLEKIPFIILGFGAGWIALKAQAQAGAIEEINSHGFLSRVAQALYGLTFYLWKTIAPANLSPLYELPLHLNPLDWPFVLSAVIIAAITLTLIIMRKRWPAALAAWVFYGIVLAPVLGFAQSGPQMVADRYSYLSCLGWALLAGAAFLRSWRTPLNGQIARARFAASAAAAIVLSVLGVLTWRQIAVWRDNQSLWQQIEAHNSGSRFRSGFTEHSIGVNLVKNGEIDKGVERIRQALRLDQNSDKYHNDLGLALVSQGKLDEAVQHYEAAVRIRPDNITALNNWAAALAKQGRLEEAVQMFRRALTVNPDESEKKSEEREGSEQAHREALLA